MNYTTFINMICTFYFAFIFSYKNVSRTLIKKKNTCCFSYQVIKIKTEAKIEVMKSGDGKSRTGYSLF